jgi:diamine N-acetyltransferase
MEETLVIRNADLDDVEAIGFLAHEIWPSAYAEILTKEKLQYMLKLFYSPETLRRNIVEEGHHFFIAEIGLQEVGYAAVSIIAPGVAKLHKLYVLPETQGKGVGRALLHAVFDESAAQGATKLRLNVHRQNVAKKFYEKEGFVIIDEGDFDIGHGFFMNDYIMERAL